MRSMSAVLNLRPHLPTKTRTRLTRPMPPTAFKRWNGATTQHSARQLGAPDELAEDSCSTEGKLCSVTVDYARVYGIDRQIWQLRSEIHAITSSRWVVTDASD